MHSQRIYPLKRGNMFISKIKLFTATTLFFSIHLIFPQSNTTLIPLDESHYELRIQIPLEAEDAIHTDYIGLTADNPHIAISDWQSNTPIDSIYDPLFHQQEKAFTESPELIITLTCTDKKTLADAHFTLSYYVQSAAQIVQEVITVELPEEINTELETQIDIPTTQELQATVEPQAITEIPASAPAPAASSSWLSLLTDKITQSDSLLFRLLLVFLLGLLMSLTPCIYPMIPITAGILQTQGSKSLITSFFLALCYTVGIATTFSILGLLAAFAGQAMGQLMSHPLFVIPLVCILVYLALSMIGLYDMYVPRFLQPRDHRVRAGSFFSAFTFGAISGVIASPCLSPGLVCLLCLVTTLNSVFLGFILLFAFGIGLGVPLLIIGTFSSSLNVLPRAGMWMIEVKKIFGFAMLGMCLYFLNYIIPAHSMGIILVAFALAIGVSFMYMASKAHSRPWHFIYTVLGILLLASSVFFAYQAFKKQYLHATDSHAIWQTDYKKALEVARAQNKKLFVDIGAPFCSICRAIDASLFADSSVITFLNENTIPVKLDGSLAQNEDVLKQFHVLGFPTVLLINPETQEVVRQWGPELYGLSSNDFIAQLKGVI
jgi:thiol:disulfide interchange protein DsbD